MSGVAAVVLAHADPLQCRRLVEALDPLPVVLHVDAKTPGDVFDKITAGWPERVHVCRRGRADLASWNLVAVELAALGHALAVTSADHVVVLSGSDYPLVSVSTLESELEARPGTRMWNTPMPVESWRTPRHPDGGLWRVQKRFLTRGGRVVYLGPVPLRWPGRRKLPEGIVLRGGSQWKIYARRHVEVLLEVVGQRPGLVEFWRSSLVPDETFAPSILASRLVEGAPPLAPDPLGAWFVRWPEGTAHHPLWLTDGDFAEIASQIEGRRRAGAEPLLFARKLSSRSGDGLRLMIDERLRP